MIDGVHLFVCTLCAVFQAKLKACSRPLDGISRCQTLRRSARAGVFVSWRQPSHLNDLHSPQTALTLSPHWLIQSDPHLWRATKECPALFELWVNRVDDTSVDSLSTVGGQRIT